MCRDRDSTLPITTWLDEAIQGNDESFAQLWAQYYPRLVALVRRNIVNGAVPFADEEDIVQNALASFCFRARDGHFPNLRDRFELWTLLLSIALTKARALDRKERRRDELRRQQFSGRGDLLRNPTPEDAAEVIDQLRHLLEQLPDEVMRRIAVAKLEGYTNEEIGSQLGLSIASVGRKLRLIRDVWSTQTTRLQPADSDCCRDEPHDDGPAMD